MLAASAAAEAPGWWSTRNVVSTNRPPHSYNPVNQGQVKWMCVQAYEELQAKIPGDENTNLLNRIDAFPDGNNFRPVNLGMLKTAAQPFYDRLIEEGYATNVPWSGKPAKDFAIANQGQLKNLFSFDLDAFDSDGDGIPDWWEKLYGATGPNDDWDNDGLTSLREYQQELNPFASDFGVSATENILVGDGSVNPPPGSLTDVLVVNGASVSAATGAWALDGSALYAAGRRGGLTYKAILPQSDIYRLQLMVRQQTVIAAGSYTYPIRIAVDGEFVARRSIVLTGSATATAFVDTPFLKAGEHTVELFWDNCENEISLRVEALTFQAYPGADSNGNGMKDWAENRLTARNTVDVAPLESRVSPVCLEGRGLFADLIRVNGTEKALHGANDRWFANVELAPDGSQTPVQLSFENGGRTLLRPVRWKPTNLLMDALANEAIRRGDALRLTAFLPGMVSGMAEIKINGQSLGTCSIDGAISHRFEQDGLYTVEGIASGVDGSGNPVSRSRTVQIQVVSADPEEILAMVNRSRDWFRPASWPDNAVMELDARVQKTGNVLKTTVSEDRYGVIRLRPSGPILAPVTVKGFNLWFMSKTYLQYDEIYEDGSFKAKTTMIMSPVVPGVRIFQQCRGPIAYEDGARVRVFNLSDFNAVGEITITFCHSSPIATSVCHYTDVYQGNIIIGLYH